MLLGKTLLLLLRLINNDKNSGRIILTECGDNNLRPLKAFVLRTNMENVLCSQRKTICFVLFFLNILIFDFFFSKFVVHLDTFPSIAGIKWKCF